jgi:DNA-binding TFAR19-related protein (PDSD5 family)
MKKVEYRKVDAEERDRHSILRDITSPDNERLHSVLMVEPEIFRMR